MILIWYPKCSTCRKAYDFLEKNSFPFSVRDIVLNTPKKEEIRDFISRSGRDISTFFNTSGIKYRELGLKNKLKMMTDDEKIEMLASDGMLIKRPILVTDEKVYVGFREKEWCELNENNKM